MLSLFREALEIGAPGVTVDFGRYPQTIDKPETANVFLRELRALANEFGKQRGKRVPIIVHFPAQGDTLWENFDYRTWAKEGTADYICPSQHNRVYLFDIQPYLDGVHGTKAKLLPDVYGGSDSLEMPGLFLWRVQQLYDAGVDGIYIYQSDARVLGPPQDRRTMRLLGSSKAVRRWWAEEDRERPRRSKGIYLNNNKHNIERIRVWLEGIKMGPVEFIVDGQPVWRCDGPPYVLGTELPKTDNLIQPGKHTLLVRAQDGKGWLEQTFSISGPG
jgi:hypothetical protein